MIPQSNLWGAGLKAFKMHHSSFSALRFESLGCGIPNDTLGVKKCEANQKQHCK